MGQKAAYCLPAAAKANLNAMVSRIEAQPGDLIDLHEFEELRERLNVRSVLKTLPEGLSEEEFIDILKLAMLTECATESYAAVFKRGAIQFDAPWLGRFTEKVWVPDELTHHTPYKLMLMSLGLSEEELDREVVEVQETAYVHCSGETPVHLTTFGMVQEYLTDNWHGLIAQLLRHSAPEAAYMANRVKKRETLHAMWYRDMTALQVEADPHFIEPVAEAITTFRMPGNVLVPELEEKVMRWMPLMNADFARISQDLVRYTHEAMGTVRRSGALLLEIAAKRGQSIGPLPPHVVKSALNRLGGPGYGLLGEAMLERVGLSFMFRKESAQGSLANLPVYGGLHQRLRDSVRSWLGRQMDLRLVTG